MQTDDVIIGSFDKNTAEEVRARFSTFHGKTYADFRVFVTNDATGDRVPTKKGLAVRPDLLENFRDLIDQAIAARDAK